ncbi:Tryptophan--tRNA ligase [Purpureocillium takamizusanense]|uniref:Tryptophan--tRNA ligase, mitochondrial n=1 Tax=Purpureocillium takamizusanense TaxID=2060973 RepID=A0A9Q8QH23_9HYPO|nr:Tryptophan--tRNA ligase [Purpureocillium takamizusanense]UNI19718.1 Tryptophan--tRNA ligase [Purpureocillium takamizusanense]
MQRAVASKTLPRARVVFSGIQPTGVPHLGNYVGALQQWLRLQHQEKPDTKLIYSIVDLHAITTPQNPHTLKRHKREALAALLAIGIDPDRCTLFYQSSVPAHSELMWILSCTASVGYLSRMTQWKQKLSLSPTSHIEDQPVSSRLKLGLFAYPVLQAADVLVHRATHVPVGHDQAQHLEFARECATNFNHAYGPCLVQPETMIPPVHRIMSLTDPTAKMSKSHKSERSRILITDTPDEIRAKISSALTDSHVGISYDIATRPGISNLLDILSIFDAQQRTPSELADAYSQTHPRQFKGMMADSVIQGLHGIRSRFLELLDSDSTYLDYVEAQGARKARENAEETMEVVRSAIGL